jgi:F-box/leucine-rich repeat protein 4
MKLDPISVLTSHQVHQWVSEVTNASSEYTPDNPNSWNRLCIRGAPNTYPRYGDIQSAWASRAARGTLEFLEFKYVEPMHIIALDIFETFNPGCVIKISANDGKGWVTIWNGEVEQLKLPEQSRIFTPKFPITSFKSNWIRIDLDCTLSRSWAEVDCVRMRGRESYEWAPQSHRRFPLEFRLIAYNFLLAMNRIERLPRDCVYEVLRKLSLYYV